MIEKIIIGDFVYHRYRPYQGIGRVVHVSSWGYYGDALAHSYTYVVRWHYGADMTCRELDIEKVPQDIIEFMDKIEDRMPDVKQI